MWQNSDLALALHRARLAGAADRRSRRRRESLVNFAVPGPTLRPAVPWAR